MEILWWVFTHNACTQMPTIDPIHTRIVDHALRMIGTFLGPGDSLRIPKINWNTDEHQRPCRPLYTWPLFPFPTPFPLSLSMLKLIIAFVQASGPTRWTLDPAWVTARGSFMLTCCSAKLSLGVYVIAFREVLAWFLPRLLIQFINEKIGHTPHPCTSVGE